MWFLRRVLSGEKKVRIGEVGLISHSWDMLSWCTLSSASLGEHTAAIGEHCLILVSIP